VRAGYKAENFESYVAKLREEIVAKRLGDEPIVAEPPKEETPPMSGEPHPELPLGPGDEAKVALPPKPALPKYVRPHAFEVCSNVSYLDVRGEAKHVDAGATVKDIPDHDAERWLAQGVLKAVHAKE
jgi:hypothetical protein